MRYCWSNESSFCCLSADTGKGGPDSVGSVYDTGAEDEFGRVETTVVWFNFAFNAWFNWSLEEEDVTGAEYVGCAAGAVIIGAAAFGAAGAATTGADIGWGDGKQQELRAGWQFQNVQWTTTTGSDGLPNYSGNSQTARVRYVYDSQDRALVPPSWKSRTSSWWTTTRRWPIP